MSTRESLMSVRDSLICMEVRFISYTLRCSIRDAIFKLDRIISSLPVDVMNVMDAFEPDEDIEEGRKVSLDKRKFNLYRPPNPMPTLTEEGNETRDNYLRKLWGKNIKKLD